jgi:ribosomal protein S12 methylthiotransferase
VKEINLIAQDLSSYGTDLCHKHLLPSLVERLAHIPGVQWLRLHYTYPTDFPEELLDVMARNSNVCKYLDIALQHCTDHMLSLMRRHITQAEQDALIQKIRDKVPGICLRTTLMVGHPGETEEDFRQLLSWVRQMRFERMGAFTYSEEEGTYAQLHYKDDVPPEVKQHRLSQLMAVQEEISGEIMQQQVGKTMTVIIDAEEPEYYIARTEQDSPEVDCEVLVSKTPGTKCRVGQFYNVTINKAEAFDLYATL